MIEFEPQKAPKAPPLSENIPSFNFSPEEVVVMRARGMTEADIEKRRREVLNKIARGQSTKH